MELRVNLEPYVQGFELPDRSIILTSETALDILKQALNVFYNASIPCLLFTDRVLATQSESFQKLRN